MLPPHIHIAYYGQSRHLARVRAAGGHKNTRRHTSETYSVADPRRCGYATQPTLPNAPFHITWYVDVCYGVEASKRLPGIIYSTTTVVAVYFFMKLLG